MEEVVGAKPILPTKIMIFLFRSIHKNLSHTVVEFSTLNGGFRRYSHSWSRPEIDEDDQTKWLYTAYDYHILRFKVLQQNAVNKFMSSLRNRT